MHKFNLSQNAFGEEGVLELVGVISEGQLLKLTRFYLYGVEMIDAAAEALLAAFEEHCPLLESKFFGGNSISSEMDNKLHGRTID